MRRSVALNTATKVKHQVGRAARSGVADALGRWGIAIRGLMYVVVGLLVVKLAGRQEDERTDREGALRALARQPLGKAILVVVAVGFTGYALWRVVQGVLDTDRRGEEPSSWVMRVGFIGLGVLYGAFAVQAIKLVVDVGEAGPEGQEQVDFTARLLDAAPGRWLVVLVGLVVIGIGVASAWRGLSRSYRKQLKTSEIGPRIERALDTLGVAGFVGRGVAFALVGGFVVHAAIQFDPREAAGLDGALKRLTAEPWGTAMILVMAVGLVAYGLFSFLEARYREVLDG